jgi:hypothetical protein
MLFSDSGDFFLVLLDLPLFETLHDHPGIMTFPHAPQTLRRKASDSLLERSTLASSISLLRALPKNAAAVGEGIARR